MALRIDAPPEDTEVGISDKPLYRYAIIQLYSDTVIPLRSCTLIQRYTDPSLALSN